MTSGCAIHDLFMYLLSTFTTLTVPNYCTYAFFTHLTRMKRSRRLSYIYIAYLTNHSPHVTLWSFSLFIDTATHLVTTLYAP
jgi:hypothetical protein